MVVLYSLRAAFAHSTNSQGSARLKLTGKRGFKLSRYSSSMNKNIPMPRACGWSLDNNNTNQLVSSTSGWSTAPTTKINIPRAHAVGQ